MQAHVCERFGATPWKLPTGEYNFDRYGRKQVLQDVRHTMAAHGIRPGQPAPDFELPLVGGGSVRLADLRGRPVLVQFGSFT